MKNKILLSFVATFTFLPILAFADTSSCIKLTKNLSKGLENTEVLMLQQFLLTKGYLTNIPNGYFGVGTLNALKKFQSANGLSQVGSTGPRTRAKIKEISCMDSKTDTKAVNTTPIVDTLPTSPQPLSTEAISRNLGIINIRAIVANIDEVGNKYGSSGIKFTQSKLLEVDQSLQRLNSFVKQSSYGKAELQWKISGVYELGKGVCDQATYGEKVNNLLLRSLSKADLETPFSDYSYFLVVHPAPDCSNNETWSFEGRGLFTPYFLNGRTVLLRGIHISDLSDQYLFHEFGHSLAYEVNNSIGHPDYTNCPITTNVNEVKIAISDTCPHVYDFSTDVLPAFSIMSATNKLSDYNVNEKEKIKWLSAGDVITTTKGTYTLSPFEQGGSYPKALKIPVSGTKYNINLSFRQPAGYIYPLTQTNKPNGVILEITDSSRMDSFLVTDSTNFDNPLKVGVSYRIGTSGLFITVNNIVNNLASVTISSNAIIPNSVSSQTLATPGSAPQAVIEQKAPLPTCQVTQQTTGVYNNPFTISWTSTNASYGISPFGDKIDVNGSATYQLSQGEEKKYNFTFFNTDGKSTTCSTFFSSTKG